MSAHSPALLATTNYLTSTGEYGAQDHVAVGQHSYSTDYAIYRHRLQPEMVWNKLSSGALSASVAVTAAEARLIGEAWLKAAEDAEAVERQKRADEDFEIDRQQTFELEEERMRDCGARGVKYSGPLTMSAYDQHNLDILQRDKIGASSEVSA